MLGVDIALQPVIRRTMAISFQGFQVLCFFPIELGSFSQHFADAKHLRTVGIGCSFALGVMLTMYCRPFLGHHAGSKPQPEAKEMAGQRMQLKRAMRLMAVQVYGDTGNRNMGKTQDDCDIPPPRQVDKT